VISATELSRLWNCHADSLLLLARMRCQSAEDCVQIAFVRLASLKIVPDDLPAWLARVVRNEAISVARSESRRRNREKQFAESSAQWIEPANESAPEISRGEIEQALQRLEPDAREILVAHVWGKLTFRQIAAAFDVSSSAAHRRYTQALELMREHLKVHLEWE
jgi:RNA polymerase sigma-70 factor (ECF subfamily)